MPRYVLLTHDHPFPHWDLLLEWGTACRTWRLLQAPVPGRVIAAEPLPDHRRHYLDYEGPVSGDRGTVARWDSGGFQTQVNRSDIVRVACDGCRGFAGLILQSGADPSRWTCCITTSRPPEVRADAYDDYAEHPRFGREPLWTGRTPLAEPGEVYLHWINRYLPRDPSRMGDQFRTVAASTAEAADLAIPGTAVEADVARQSPSTVPVTHYFDVRRLCCDCGRPFLLFALEQKHWYEDLQLNLASDAVRCPECRYKQRSLVRLAQQYDALLRQLNRSEAEADR
jgi:DNA-directed RNA polymerase subunit RPC12/RpoP